jgi:diacylglycerol kinase
VPKKFIKSFKHARAGAEHALRTQRNIWIHFLVALGALAMALWLKISLVEFALLLLTITFVIVIEMLNTALEEAVNLIQPQQHPLAALAKNVAAGAVLVAALGSVVVGLLIFTPRFLP